MTYSSSNTAVVKVNSKGKVAIKGAGTAQITIKAAADDTYAAAEKVITITVLAEKKTQKISASGVTTSYSYNKKITIGASAKGKLTYSSSDKSVAKVTSKGVLQIKGPGTAKITIKAAETSLYKAATKTITVKVNPKKGGFTSYSSTSAKTVKLQWKKDTLVTGYQLQMATNSKFSGKRSAVAGKNQTTTTIRGLQSGKTYYFRIRSYYKVNGKTLYGAWSTVRKVKVK